MSNIKMSDVFELPITSKLVNGDARLLISGSGHLITSFSGIPNAAMHMANAINVYDANQEQLHTLHGAYAVVEQENTELMRRVRHWKSNHDNLVTKLRVYTSRPDITINKQQEEIKALKAQVDKIKYAANVYSIGLESKEADLDLARLIMISTPQQCLADVRADAVESFKESVFDRVKGDDEDYVNSIMVLLNTTKG